MERPALTFLIGCTACGKSAVGFELARRIGGEIISVDSMKVYRRMDIGTAKPSPAQREEVRYHLVDVVEPWEEFSVARYADLADGTIRDIQHRGRPMLVVGGTALYINALAKGLFDGPGEDPQFRRSLRERAQREGTGPLHDELRRVDPQAAGRIHPNDYRRIERALEVYALAGKPISQLQTQWEQGSGQYDCRFIGLRREKVDQNHRINMRTKRMIESGLLDEVQALLAEDKPLSRQASQAVGYAEMIRHLEGRMSLEDAVEQIKINSRQLAKSQRTWFKRFADVQWLDVAEKEPVDSLVGRVESLFGL